MYKVTIIWGQSDQKKTDYCFDTLQEVRAFLWGVYESNGWLDYELDEVLENGKPIEI